MPTLIVENVPVETYDRLQERATAQQRSVPEEALHLLNQLVGTVVKPTPRLPDFISSQEIAAPCDLPRTSQPVAMHATWGLPRLPDALDERLSE